MTIAPEFFLWTLVALLLVAAAFLVGLFLTYRVKGGSLADQVSTARYVLAYDDALTWLGVQGKRRKSLLAELKSNIADASGDRPVKTALGALGDPRELARAIMAGTRGPSWALGAIVALSVWFVFQFAGFVGLDLIATGVERLNIAGAHLNVSTLLLPGVQFAITTDAKGALDTLSVEMGPLAWVAPILAFAIFSRPWRLIATRRTATN